MRLVIAASKVQTSDALLGRLSIVRQNERQARVIKEALTGTIKRLAEKRREDSPLALPGNARVLAYARL